MIYLFYHRKLLYFVIYRLFFTQSSKVITEGDYVFFIMLSGYDNTLTEDDELLEYFNKQNDIAVEAISSVI